jgi:hypothetical protein
MACGWVFVVSCGTVITRSLVFMYSWVAEVARLWWVARALWDDGRSHAGGVIGEAVGVENAGVGEGFLSILSDLFTYRTVGTLFTSSLFLSVDIIDCTDGDFCRDSDLTSL